MQKCAPLFTAHLGVSVAEHEAYCRKEVTFPRAIAANDDIMLRRKGLNYCLVFIADEKLAPTADLSILR